MCELLQRYCDNMLTAGTPNAAAPDVYVLFLLKARYNMI